MNLLDILHTAMLAIRKLGAYALLELVMPGGTVLVLLLYLYRRHRHAGAGATARFAGRAFVARRSLDSPRGTLRVTR